MGLHRWNPGRQSVVCNDDTSNLHATDDETQVSCTACIARLALTDDVNAYWHPQQQQRRVAIAGARAAAEQQLADEEAAERAAIAAARADKIADAERRAGAAFDAAVKAAKEPPAPPKGKSDDEGKGGKPKS